MGELKGWREGLGHMSVGGGSGLKGWYEDTSLDGLSKFCSLLYSSDGPGSW